MRNYRVYQKLLSLLGIALASAALSAFAQPPFSFGAPAGVLGEGDRVPKLEAGFTTPDAKHAAQLFIIATMPEGAHTYSITQPPKGPNRTLIKIGTSSDVPSIGGFQTVGPPQVKHDEDIFPKIPLEEQSGTVKWYAPIQLADGAKPESIKLEGKVSMQLCDENGCVAPRDYPFTATYRPDVPAEAAAPPQAPVVKPAAPPANQPAPAIGPVVPAPQPAGNIGQGDIAPRLEAAFTTPGPDGAAQLFVTATLRPGLNTYSITQPPGGPSPTSIKIDATPDLPSIGDFIAITLPENKFNQKAFPGVPMEEHTGTVKWVAPIRFAPNVQAASLQLHGAVRMQICDEKGCFPPRDYPFAAALNPAMTSVLGLPQPPMMVSNNSNGNTSNNSSSYVAKPPAMVAEGEIDWLPFTNAAGLREIVGPGLDIDQVRQYVHEQASSLGIIRAIFWGFLGGLILNVMPCVLPVIGLKILSFSQQSGHDRRKAFMLNLSYSLGLVSVFLVLAMLAVVLHFGWGELFGMTWFKITLAAVVFVMSLSFMGVWEAPLPTFLGGGKTGELAAQEGVTGAFFKGVLTTFLATPCSAPLLAPAVAWATSQPAIVTFSVFLSAGLGMASPYLLIGAFPALLRFLPKPGDWMETFKQFMGFVLICTVVYLLAVIKPQYVVPTVGLLLSLAFMCWWVGRIGPELDTMTKLRRWAQGAVVVGATWIFMFPGIQKGIFGSFQIDGLVAAMTPPAPPVSSTPAALTSQVAGPKTVLVDFSASWCLTCHVYENNVLRTTPVIDCLRRLDVVTLKADWSDESPEVSAMLDVLGSRQIPVVAIFSARDPNHPTVFRGSYTQQDILKALEKAGPSPRAQVASGSVSRMQ